MKKIIAVTLALIMALSMTACTPVNTVGEIMDKAEEKEYWKAEDNFDLTDETEKNPAEILERSVLIDEESTYFYNSYTDIYVDFPKGCIILGDDDIIKESTFDENCIGKFGIDEDGKK